MKIRSGSRRPGMKVHGKRTARRGLFLICLAALALLGAGLVLAGCGRLSLTGLLLNEEPGEFDVSPGGANVAVGTKLTLTASGGFKPYSFATDSGVGTVNPGSGIYEAPGSVVAGSYAQAEILATDYLGGTTSTTLTVFNPLTLNVGAVTIAEGDDVAFDADGGVSIYSFYVNGSSTPSHTSVDGVWNSTSWSPAGVHLVEVVDAIGNVAAATVTVLVLGGSLAINPVAASVEQEDSVFFTGINVSLPADYSADPDVGNIAPSGNDANYTAPAAPFEGWVTITLEDAVDSVTASVYVYDPADPPDDLTITPSAVGEDLGYGDTLVFTAAGGVLPYTFSLDPGDLGEIEKIAYDQARYTAPSSKTTDRVQLTDAVGATLRVKVKVKG